jgi:hypothetical protein
MPCINMNGTATIGRKKTILINNANHTDRHNSHVIKRMKNESWYLQRYE